MPSINAATISPPAGKRWREAPEGEKPYATTPQSAVLFYSLAYQLAFAWEQPLTWGATAAAPYAVSSDWLSWDSAIWRYTSQLSSSSLCVP